jgi:gluconolactonase
MKKHTPGSCLLAFALIVAACTPAATDNQPSGSGGSRSSGGSGGQANAGSGGSSGSGAGGTSSSGGQTGGTSASGGAGASSGGSPGQASGGQGGGASGGSGGQATGSGGHSGGGGSAADAGPVDQASAEALPPAVMKFPPTGGMCPDGPFGNPLPASTTATLIKAMAGSLEGPLWVASQKALYLCVVGAVAMGGRIDKYVPATNTFSTFAMGLDVAGLALDPAGAIVAASFDSRNLTKFDIATGKRTSIPGSDKYMGKFFDQTNDLVIRSDGNVYFTDTDYRQDGRAGQETTAYYRFSPQGVVTRIGAGSEPNGIALSPDGHTLYVSSSEGDPLRKWALDDAGAAVGTATVFSDLTSDGMTVDCAGNLYLSNLGTIKVLAPDGKMLGMITGLGASTVSNAAFGGPDMKTLFITTASALYKIEMNVPGFPN